MGQTGAAGAAAGAIWAGGADAGGAAAVIAAAGAAAFLALIMGNNVTRQSQPRIVMKTPIPVTAKNDSKSFA